MNEVDKYMLFLDLDGVLADFDTGVIRSTGKPPSDLQPRRMWPILARTPDFYAELDWMEDGNLLWEFCEPYAPIILTGLPMGKWAEPQKRSWCKRELGDNVEVITCMSRQKAEFALNRSESKTPILVDDRLKLKESWEEMGGIFILHMNSERSISELKSLGF